MQMQGATSRRGTHKATSPATEPPGIPRGIANVEQHKPQPRPPAPRRFRLSLGKSLLWGTIAVLGIAYATTHRELVAVRQELKRALPIPIEEVARQFQESTTSGPIATQVRDVRYSSTDDSYKVKYSWVDPATGQTWSSDRELAGNGYGAYLGRIGIKELCEPWEKSGHWIVVKARPSAAADAAPIDDDAPFSPYLEELRNRPHYQALLFVRTAHGGSCSSTMGRSNGNGDGWSSGNGLTCGTPDSLAKIDCTFTEHYDRADHYTITWKLFQHETQTEEKTVDVAFSGKEIVVLDNEHYIVIRPREGPIQ